ncbi:SnoaL-like polyketide cyclase-domain-containing protein [Xylaria sp. FL0933]|nr:SnoaL-like polyketide cyclase-domain-containing protein [Xylaria sp. FL0933]
MATIASTFRSFIECINEERWQDLTNFASFPLDYNGEDIGAAEALADKFKAVGYGQLDIDAVTVDEQSQRLGATLVAKLHSVEGVTRDLTQQSQIIAWAENGKISKIATLVDHDDIQRQLSEPGYVSTPDLISTYSPDSTRTTLSRQELEDTYRAYIACINAQTMAADLPRFCHPHVTHNAKRLSLDKYRALIQEAFTAVPDIVFGVDTVVADEKAQRVAVRLEFTGTPTGKLSGAEPTGRSVRFYEYVTYAFRDGKIDRVWSIVDWKSYRQHLLKK